MHRDNTLVFIHSTILYFNRCLYCDIAWFRRRRSLITYYEILLNHHRRKLWIEPHEIKFSSFFLSQLRWEAIDAVVQRIVLSENVAELENAEALLASFATHRKEKDVKQESCTTPSDTLSTSCPMPLPPPFPSSNSHRRRLVISIGRQRFGSQILGGKNLWKICFQTTF